MFSITVDTRSWSSHLAEVQKQIPYSLMKSLNEVTLLGQLGERTHMTQIFRVRRVWTTTAVKIVHFAKKTELWTQIGIHPQGGDQRADILTKFETETQKTPFAGTHIAVPIGPNAGKIARAGQRLRDFNMRQVGNKLEGDQGVFGLSIGGGKILILQRRDHRTRYKKAGKSVSVAKGDATPLYLLVPRVKITPNLEFEKTILAIVNARWDAIFSVNLDAALATAR